VHGAVAQLQPVHLAPRPLPDHPVLFIHHVEKLVGILRHLVKCGTQEIRKSSFRVSVS